MRHFLTGPRLLMWEFILSGCLLFRPNVLTRQRLVYDGSHWLSTHLVPSATGVRGGDCVQPGVEVLLPKVFSLGTDRSDVFLGTWWALCILSRTGTFLDLERATAKSAGQPLHLTSGKLGLTFAKNPVCFCYLPGQKCPGCTLRRRGQWFTTVVAFHRRNASGKMVPSRFPVA